MPQVPVNPTPNKAPTPVKTTPAATTPAKVAGKSPVVAPEEQFWKRYSPHNEFSLSGATSIALHVVGIGLLLLLAWIFFKPGDAKSDVPLMDMVQYDGKEVNNPKEGGGGEGGEKPEGPKENVDPDNPPDNPNNNNGNNGPGLEDPKELPMVEIVGNKDGTRTIGSGTAPADLDIIGKQSYKVLAQRKAKSSGKDGGAGGGKDKGVGKGNGETEVARAKRQLRWRVIFNQNSNGEDYLDKLLALRAILVVAEFKPGRGGRPATNDQGKPILMYRLVIRNLAQHPAKPKQENVSEIPGIFWIDDKPDSVAALFEAMGLRTPPLFACFFSDKVEDDLRALEKAKFKGDENAITETRFRIVEDSNGRYKGKNKSYRLVCDSVSAN